MYLDLIGIPPTAEELDRFLANPTSQAYEQIVDDLNLDNTFELDDWWGEQERLTSVSRFGKFLNGTILTDNRLTQVVVHC